MRFCLDPVQNYGFVGPENFLVGTEKCVQASILELENVRRVKFALGFTKGWLAVLLGIWGRVAFGEGRPVRLLKIITSKTVDR